MVLKDESKKLVSCLHNNLKNQNDCFINEKNQLYSFIEKLTADFEELTKKFEIEIEIPSKFFIFFYLFYYLKRIRIEAIGK